VSFTLGEGKQAGKERLMARINQLPEQSKKHSLPLNDFHSLWSFLRFLSDFLQSQVADLIRSSKHFAGCRVELMGKKVIES
jgi:hypothetical protein